jgi:iron complex outermembrane receptor protein
MKEVSPKKVSYFRPSHISLLVAAAFPMMLHAQSNLGTVSITGDQLGSGLMAVEESPKARSSVSKAAMEQNVGTANPYQNLSLLPGVYTYNHDASGLFGGSLTMRGFNSDQLGFTIDGAPVNDSGNFAVYPQEYVDSENMCEMFVTQGSTDNNAPHIGASGGNIGMVTCDPENTQRIRASQTLGSYNLSRTFVRFDSGKINNDSAKFFMSYSKSQVDKWKGFGKADRDHIDAKLSLEGEGGNRYSVGVIYNKAINNNFYTPTRTDIATAGRTVDYKGTFTAANTAPTNQNIYYGMAINPFENALLTGNATLKLDGAAQLNFTPYFWYGYGTGGTQQKVFNEATTKALNSAGVNASPTDFNRNGTTTDILQVANSSLTKTYRPGVVGTYSNQIDNHNFNVGGWYEHARHMQTGPAVYADANGGFDPWLQSNPVLRSTGQPYNSRDYKTVTTVTQLFAQDSISLMNEKMTLALGLKTPQIKRDFTESANEGQSLVTGSTGSTAPMNYNVVKDYSKVLPSVGVSYKLTAKETVFASVAQNFKAPPNFATASNNIKFINNVPQFQTIVPETSTNVDVGYRVAEENLVWSATLFMVDFKNRQANAYDPVTGVSTYTNAGGVKNQGLELELGTKPQHGWSYYGSLSIQDSVIQNDLKSSSTATLATSGKQFPLAPKYMSGLSAQYADGPFSAQLRAKYTGKVYSTLMNDDAVAGYTVFDLYAGYKLESGPLIKNPVLKLNVSNLFNREYMSPTGSSNSYSATGTRYYIGAPRMTSVSLQADF